MADFGKRSLYLFLFSLLFSAIFRTNLMYYFLIIEFFYLVYLHYSRIELTYQEDNKIQIKQGAEEELTLHLPVEVNRWWNYLPVQKPKLINSPSIERIKHSRQSIVMSYLEIIDSQNQKINFVEKIVYGTRFPNESEYLLKTPDLNHPTIKINRTDKLFDFITDCTYQKK